MRLSRPAALTTLAAGFATLAIAAPALAAPATVDVGDSYFRASDVTVNVGETVTWNWSGSGHNVDFTSGPEKIAASPLNNTGATFSHTFTKPGTYSYICDAHPGKMSATVTVVDAGQPAPAAAGTQPTAAGSSPQQVSGPAGPVTAGLAGVDAAAPALSRIAFRAGTLRLRVSEAAKLTMRYVKTGRDAHVVATRRLTAHKGTNVFHVRRWMHPGRYRVSIVAADRAGNDSKPARLKLTVRR